MDPTARTLDDGKGPSVQAPETLIAGRYRLRGVLGRGGMGTVYRAEDLELGELVALKVVSRGSSSGVGLERQRDEVKLARRVTHLNVARTFDIGDHDGMRFITMELVDGPSLRDAMESDTNLEARLRLLRDLADGLGAIHDAGIAHRDLKPENVLITSAGVAKITDFGIARAASSVTRGMTTGTPRYMAPEVLAGEPPTAAADIFAFGLVAYELLTGARFLGGSPALAARALRARLGSEREAVTAFLEQCLAEAPASRPSSTQPLDALLAREPASAALSSAVASTKTVRLGAAVFATDEADAWLSDSIPAEVLRLLATRPGLQIATALVPAEGAAHVASNLGIDVILLGSVQRAGEQLRVAVRVVSAVEQLQLWARTTQLTMATLDEGLREIASLAANAVLDQERDLRTIRTREPRVTELLLLASHEDHSPWRDLRSAAPELLEEARLLAPDDPEVLAMLAQMLLRGAGWADERYYHARRVAERAVELDGASPDCQLALAETLLVANEPLGSITSLRSVLRTSPSEPHAHSIVGAIAFNVGLLAESIGRNTLALALDPGLAVARVNVVLARGLGGEYAAADALIDAGLADDALVGRFLIILAAARLAAWRGSPAIESLLPRLAALAHPPFIVVIEPLIAALTSARPAADAVASMGPLAHIAPAWALQRCFRLQLEAELLVHQGAHAEAAKKVHELVAAGSYHSSWFTGCPLIVKLARHVDIEEPRIRIEARASVVLAALRDAGLTGAPRRASNR